MIDFIDDLRALKEGGQPGVLCIVTATSGSTPRKAGTRMLVFAGGTSKGTIGGGAVEHQAVEIALQALDKGVPFTRHFELLDDLSMECGGTMDIYFEPIGVAPRLYIFGAGHVGKALASFTPAFGFRTTVIDDRDGIFSNWDVPDTEFLLGNYTGLVNEIEYGEHTYIVVVTHKHEYDEQLMVACAPRDYAYLGMIGSKRKVAEIKARALDKHHLSPEVLGKVDMPVGIPFAAETPAEIAISILARLIDVKNRRNN
ncbi:hypothetical protein SDC9_41223 [bioreactor metagenome]|jgi:xanthine dehydrogenase accessory factor|uniref:Xanthine dehydrogenase subunit A n=1 Tax=bioreactor metagenome TaxID=1076179 RepID=A0A644VV12_9ZZZZ|nr:XdhC family protein [Lentimicrobium sp.]MEA5110222.1 XdhC family protein [Lentimicrobium sp.]